jgi:proteic killer suppression protein
MTEAPFERVAQRKLRQLDIATELRDLASPPGNDLEALKGDRKGQHSIRINEQWRLCFVWRDRDAGRHCRHGFVNREWPLLII